MSGGPVASGAPEEQLAAARRRIDHLDQELVRLAAERLAAAAEAGRAKARMGQSLVDFQREREVMGSVQAAARRHGIDEALAQDLVTRLITASTTRQESERVAATQPGRGKGAVVVGGAGRMGGWLVRFLRTSGYRVLVLDPAAPEGKKEAAAALPSADLVLLAVPPSAAAQLYEAWAKSPPKGVVADIASIKSPLVPALRSFAKAGGRVASFHPMFGPAATMLRGADVVLCRTGDAAATKVVRDLFSPTLARLVDVDLEEHDALMAEALTLAHATAIAFATSQSAPMGAPQSTTLRRLRDVASSVVDESPRVYYEIQVGNPHSAEALARLAASVERLRAAVAARDEPAFRALLDEGRHRIAEGGTR